jgi:hypothetical protein
LKRGVVEQVKHFTVKQKRPQSYGKKRPVLPFVNKNIAAIAYESNIYDFLRDIPPPQSLRFIGGYSHIQPCGFSVRFYPIFDE